ncbi:hypothetical protein ACLQ25_08430 [Micromonospora sp. DT44]|uniref:hypothetical protein n=1 Tax=Micromonospora sp. DT44 TaxID=3393439 RepID=UPI003CE91477
MIRRLVSAVTGRVAARGGPPVPPGTGARIQAVEQERAKRLLLAEARSITPAHHRASHDDGPAR